MYNLTLMYKTCVHKKVPGVKISVLGHEFPQGRCNLIENLLVELKSRQTQFLEPPHICGGVLLSEGAESIYKNIIQGELLKFLDLSPKCEEHMQPCRTCGAKAQLWQQGGIKNLQIVKS